MSVQDTTTSTTSPSDDGVVVVDADQVDDPDVTTTTEDSQDPEGADKLGDAGKKALDTMKQRLKDERTKRQAAEKALADASKPKPTEGTAPDPEQLRTEARAEAAAEVLRERALDKAVVAAAGKLANPEDARAFLAGQVEDFLDDNKIDQAAITSAITDLITARPYLAAQGGKKFPGTADGGTRKGSGKSEQVTEQEFKSMSATEMTKALAEGRLTNLL